MPAPFSLLVGGLLWLLTACESGEERAKRELALMHADVADDGRDRADRGREKNAISYLARDLKNRNELRAKLAAAEERLSRGKVEKTSAQRRDDVVAGPTRERDYFAERLAKADAELAEKRSEVEQIRADLHAKKAELDRQIAHPNKTSPTPEVLRTRLARIESNLVEADRVLALADGGV